MRKSGKFTPWGQADGQEELAPGIISYSTASHGGIWLSAERRKALNYDKNWLKTAEWWEEDCDWAVPYYFFAADILAHGKAYKFESNLKAAIETVRRFHPEFLERMAA
jgi:hypothetical protein